MDDSPLSEPADTEMVRLSFSLYTSLYLSVCACVCVFLYLSLFLERNGGDSFSILQPVGVCDLMSTGRRKIADSTRTCSLL